MVTDLFAKDIKNGTTTDPGKILYVVMFYSSRCHPCTFTMPHYEKMAEYFTFLNAPVKFHRMNVSDDEENKNYYYNSPGTGESRGVPHFKVYYREEILLDRTGGGDEETLKKFIHDSIDEAFKKYGDRL